MMSHPVRRLLAKNDMRRRTTEWLAETWRSYAVLATWTIFVWVVVWISRAIF